MQISQIPKIESPPKSQLTQNNKKTSSIKLSMTESLINLYDLHQFVKTTFNGCMLPDLLQFVQVQLEVENNKHCKINLEKFKKSIFRNQEDCDYIYFVQAGKVILKTKIKQEVLTQDQLIKKLRVKSANKLMTNSKIQNNKSLSTQKTTQIKQGNFFVLTNTRKILDPQFYQVYGHENGELGCCLIGKIKINKKYSLNWYISQSQKNFFLNPLFQNASEYIHQQKIKGLIKHFQYQKYRRGAILATEGQTNDKLMILKSGQIQYTKSIAIHQKNHTNIKVIKIANGETRAIIGEQMILFDLCGSSKVGEIAMKGLQDYQQQVQNQSTKFKVFEKKINNFTIIVLSAYVQIFWIQFAKFKQICEKYVPQVPQNIRKNIQSNYVTLLRTTKQKLQLQFAKIKRNQIIVKQQRQTLQIKLASGQINFNHKNSVQNKIHSPIKLKPSQLIQTNLRGQQVQKMRTKRLQKKIQLLLEASNFNTFHKNKFEIVSKEKPYVFSTTQSPSFQKVQNLYQTSPELLQNQNQGQQMRQVILSPQAMISRSNSIKRQSHIINIKQQMLKKRYASQNNLLLLNQDRSKNKRFKIDMIKRGIQYSSQKQQNKFTMMQLSNRIKKDCVQKINKANKIKQQYMTIRSQCQNCHCYDDVEGSKTHINHKDIKSQTMMTGSAWKITEIPIKHQQMPLEKLHSTVKLVSEKSKKKYNHNIHLHLKSKAFFSTTKRRMSAPIL